MATESTWRGQHFRREKHTQEIVWRYSYSHPWQHLTAAWSNRPRVAINKFNTPWFYNNYDYIMACPIKVLTLKHSSDMREKDHFNVCMDQWLCGYQYLQWFSNTRWRHFKANSPMLHNLLLYFSKLYFSNSCLSAAVDCWMYLFLQVKTYYNVHSEWDGNIIISGHTVTYNVS